MKWFGVVVCVWVGCTRPNPAVCCENDVECTRIGLAADDVRNCTGESVCVANACVASGCDDDGDCTAPNQPFCISERARRGVLATRIVWIRTFRCVSRKPAAWIALLVEVVSHSKPIEQSVTSTSCRRTDSIRNRLFPGPPSTGLRSGHQMEHASRSCVLGMSSSQIS